MRKVFLSHSFGEQDRVLVTQIESMTRSHGLLATSGRALGGGALTPEIKRAIDDADALVALLTKRDNDPPNVTHPWVIQEFGYARLLNKRAIGFYELGVPVVPADSGFERIEYDPQSAVAAFVRLSETLGAWKRGAGRLLKVQLLPDEAARALVKHLEQIRCKCRFHCDGVDTEWQDVQIRREIGGVFITLRVSEDAQMVQFRTEGARQYESAYTPLWTPVHFEPTGAVG